MYINHKKSSKQRTGFTLLETMLAIAILVLLSGTIMFLIQGTLESTALIEKQVKSEDEKYAFEGLCRQIFRTLGVEIAFTTNKNSEGVDLVFKNAPRLFQWDTNDTSSIQFDPVTLTIVKQATDNLLRINVIRGIGDQQAELPLLINLKSVSWHFYDSKKKEWLDSWESTKSRPTLIELLIGFQEEEALFRSVFWLPPMDMEAETKLKLDEAKVAISKQTVLRELRQKLLQSKNAMKKTT